MLDGFRRWRMYEGDSATTAAERLYAVKTFLRVALSHGLLTHEQAVAMRLKPYARRQPHVEQPIGRRLDSNEVAALRTACNAGTTKGKRDLAVIDLMLYAGLKAHEVAGMRVEHLRDERGGWWIAVPGRGHSARRIVVHDALHQSLAEWMTAAGLTLGAQRHLFLSVNKFGRVTNNCITSSIVARLVSEYGSKAGLSGPDGRSRLSCYDLCRTCARNAYEHGASPLLIHQMLGNSDLKTTLRYLYPLDHEAETAVDYLSY
jgi:site-specific recombinase XerD